MNYKILLGIVLIGVLGGFLMWGMHLFPAKPFTQEKEDVYVVLHVLDHDACVKLKDKYTPAQWDAAQNFRIDILHKKPLIRCNKKQFNQELNSCSIASG